MQRLVGLETEYGLYIEGKNPSELVFEAAEVVRCYNASAFASPWDYRREDPRKDARGFYVDHLQTDPVDAQYDAEGDSSASMSADTRSDRVLTNGARLYNDHGHPEYSTPECVSLRELVAHDRAGERIVWRCAQEYMRRTGLKVHIFKNNTDFHGASYGCHEGYLMRRSVPFEHIIRGMMPFFVTRILYAGAGKVGVETPGVFGDVPYQLSQRADFFSVEASVDTLYQRPIINTRDEPHATPSRYRRLHVICGDANMSEYATALKVGTTRLVAELIEEGWQPGVALRNPVETIRRLSRDPEWKWLVELEDGRTLPAIEVQRLYLQEAQKQFAHADTETQWLLMAWESTLNALESDPQELADSLDWVAKRLLLEQFIENEGVAWREPIVQSLDLAYHSIDPQEGLFAGLEQIGAVRRVVTDKDIERAVCHPPNSTRAWVRGALVERYPEAISGITWSRVVLSFGEQLVTLDLRDWVTQRVPQKVQRLAKAHNLTEFVNTFRELHASRKHEVEGGKEPCSGEQTTD
ncbi:MAG: proteasome accessory factor PafA2 family protein [Armatimonadota bacterium]|nr:proteasome accessory factor PafA2 family protein [bacterium]MDW8320367.1 proteasome accessory factor PafA2 family protein [Armatimonadota bacterium]